MATDKSNPWWDDDADSKSKENAPQDSGMSSGGGVDENIGTDTPATIQAMQSANPPEGQAVSGGTEPTIVSPGFSQTPPAVNMQDPGMMGGQPAPDYGGFPGGGMPPPAGAFSTPTPPTMSGFQDVPGGMSGGYSATQALPMMPGSMPDMPPATMGLSQDQMTEYQQLQLSDLGTGIPYAAQGGNLGMLLDVPVPLTVVLGRAVLRIQEVLGLQPGSVVPLDRNAEEPVDLLIKDKLIAQGEVVVIDGNFGIKITKILEPEHRVRDLG